MRVTTLGHGGGESSSSSSSSFESCAPDEDSDPDHAPGVCVCVCVCVCDVSRLPRQHFEGSHEHTLSKREEDMREERARREKQPLTNRCSRLIPTGPSKAEEDAEMVPLRFECRSSHEMTSRYVLAHALQQRVIEESHREKGREGETGRKGDRETGRQGDRETGRQTAGRQPDSEITTVSFPPSAFCNRPQHLLTVSHVCMRVMCVCA